jgi:hypothetical protein
MVFLFILRILAQPVRKNIIKGIKGERSEVGAFGASSKLKAEGSKGSADYADDLSKNDGI